MPKVNRRAPKPAVSTSVLADPPAEQPDPIETDRKPRPKEWLEDGFPNPAAHDIVSYMGALTPEQWSDHMLYVYRTKPRVIRTPGEPGYLDRFTAPITPEDLRVRYGGWRFLLTLNRTMHGKDGNRDKTVYNKSWNINARPIPNEGERFEPGWDNETSTGGEGGNSSIVRDLIDDLRSQRDAAMDHGTGSEQAKEYQKILQLQRELFLQDGGGASRGGEGMIEKLFLLVAPKLVEQLFQPAESRLESTLALIEAIKGQNTTVNTNGVWESAMVAAINQLPAVFDRGVEISRNWAYATRGEVPPPWAPTPGQPQAIAPPVPEVVTPAAAAESSTAAGKFTAADQAEPIGESSTINKTEIVHQAISRAFRDGQKGYVAATASYYIDAEYTVHLVQLISDSPAELMKIPAFAALAQDSALRSKLPEFLKEFVEDFKRGSETPSERSSPTPQPAATAA